MQIFYGRVSYKIPQWDVIYQSSHMMIPAGFVYQNLATFPSKRIRSKFFIADFIQRVVSFSTVLKAHYPYVYGISD